MCQPSNASPDCSPGHANDNVEQLEMMPGRPRARLLCKWLAPPQPPGSQLLTHSPQAPWLRGAHSIQDTAFAKWPPAEEQQGSRCTLSFREASSGGQPSPNSISARQRKCSIVKLKHQFLPHHYPFLHGKQSKSCEEASGLHRAVSQRMQVSEQQLKRK